jgi:hypothetical protein
MNIDPRLEAVSGRLARLTDLLDALASEATNAADKHLALGLGAGALTIAAEYSGETYNALVELLDEAKKA